MTEADVKNEKYGTKCDLLNRYAALTAFIIGIIIFITVGKMEGDPATLNGMFSCMG